MNENIVKSKENRRKIYISLLVTVICLIGLTYALFTIFLKQTENNSLATRTCFSTSLTEETSKITLDKAYPLTHEKGLETTPFTFKLTNNCDKPVKVYITIDSTYRTSTDTAYLSDSYIRENINLKGETTAPSVILTEQTLKEIDNGNQGYLIKETWLEANEEKEYDLRLWMDESVTVEQGLNKTWKGSVVVSAVAETKLPTWDAPEDGTLLAAIKNNNTVTVPTTTPGSEISSSTEALLASTEDDYGTSYYFRGAVENNYVEYANMCWRIVRVTGDGSIKLVLYNYNGITSTNNTPSSSTPCNVTGDDLSLARFEGDTYTSAFNSSYNDNAYVGLMYGTESTSSYADAHANTNPSTILTNLNKWYTNVLSKQANFNDNQLVDTIWCNDKSVVTDTAFNPGSYTLGTNYGYAKNKNYYNTAKRLVQASSWSAGGTGPSLICPNDNNGGKLSKFTVSDTTYGNGALSGYAKVGLLTADEIAFAGGAYGTSNSTYYIKGNTNSTFWWALSPFGFNGDYTGVWGVRGNGSGLGFGHVRYGFGVRPSLSLQSGVKISSGGVGSATNPYKIAI
ncbi:MAG: hypothetical protein MST00_02630 [Tenericutes bacterium]|nr:hypothetical protein [Mycoplasmatota bacterium]